ncbi:MAG: hypothetical protein ACHQU1_05865 [Gemmatimonadales bacterium]
MRRLLSAVALVAMAVSPAAAQRPRVNVTRVGDTLLIVKLGPVRLPAHADHMDIDQLTLQTWRMPAAGWLRGYHVEIVDKDGAELPHELLHHAEMVDLERRDLLRPALNRIVSAGKETSSLLLPPGMGYPVRERHELGINAMLGNATATEYPEAYVRATITLAPAGTPDVRSVMSLFAETSYDTTGDSDFDLPPGESNKVVEFTVPVGGRVLGLGGHIHDYGTRFVVVRAGTNDTVYNAVPRLDSTGAVAGMPQVPMFGRSLHLAPGDHFVMTVFYNNPSGRLLEKAGMGTFGMVFVPDDVAQWPSLDRNDPGVKRDLAGLRSGMMHDMHQGMQMHN